VTLLQPANSGHSKTMMGALIVAIRGTLAPAVLPGLPATVSHTAIGGP
jgi:nickel/cobalt exporter